MMDWKCKVCTYNNLNDSDICDMCGTPDFHSSSPEIEEVGGAHAFVADEKPVDSYLEPSAWQCESCSYLNSHENQNCEFCNECRIPQSISSYTDQGESSDVEILGWECDDCKYFNYGGDKYCEMCHELYQDDIPITSYSKATQRHKHNHHRKKGFKGNRWVTTNSPLANMTEDAERIILLIGKTGSGKSATGNCILNKNAFYSAVSGQSVTDKCQTAQAERFGRLITVVDTPGLFDTRSTNASISNEIVKCTEMILPGPHAVVLVIRIGRFTQEEQDTVKHFADQFGEDVFKYMIILFTGEDDLDAGYTSVEEFVSNSTDVLKNILRKCDFRYIAFNNRACINTKEEQAQELIRLINEMLFRNGGHFFTNEMLKEAENNLRMRLIRIAEEEDEKQRQETERIKRKERKKQRKELERQMIDTDRLYCLKITKEWENEDKERERRGLEQEKESLERELRQARRKLKR